MSKNNISAESSKSDKGKRLSLPYRFFCWCSGSRVYLIEQCPTDYNTYFGIGIVIFLTGLMATISGSYAFYTIFKIDYLAAIFGLFWGTLIFFLDWYLVSSLKKQNNLKKELFLSFPRIVFAIFLAVVISKPIELKLFESEINSKITAMQLTDNLKKQKLLDKEFDEIQKLRSDNESMAIQIKAKEIYRNQLFDLVITEAEGTAGTGRAGKGSVYKEKKEALDQSTKELNELKKSMLPLIEANTMRIAELTKQKDSKLNTVKTIAEKNDGFLARMDAMSRLSAENQKINIISWFIVLMFICIESAPIFVKLISDRSMYDELLELEVLKHQLEARRKFDDYAIFFENKNKIELEKKRGEFDAAIESNKEFISQVTHVQQELNSKVIEQWKATETENINNNIDSYISRIKSIFNTESITHKTQNSENGSGTKEMA